MYKRQPFYEFELKLDRQYIGRAMTDLERMGAVFTINDTGEEVLVTGCGPVSSLANYQAELTAYTRGTGSINLRMSGYRPCHNTEEVIEKIGYDVTRDIRNTPDSVFCAHGSGFTVSWDEVSEYAHVDSVLNPPKTSDINEPMTCLLYTSPSPRD